MNVFVLLINSKCLFSLAQLVGSVDKIPQVLAKRLLLTFRKSKPVRPNSVIDKSKPADWKTRSKLLESRGLEVLFTL